MSEWTLAMGIEDTASRYEIPLNGRFQPWLRTCAFMVPDNRDLSEMLTVEEFMATI